MNQVTFNNPFKVWLDAKPVQGHIVRDKWPRPEQILAAPLFTADWTKLTGTVPDHSDDRTWAARNEILFADDRTLR